MGQGDTITSKRQIPVMLQSEADSNRAATIHILQHQPTARPIEDRYSIDVQICEEDASGSGQTTLLLGVYDGHRGSSAAAYIAQALPSAVLSTVAHLSNDADGQTQLIQDTFETFDRQMISSFQDAHSNKSEGKGSRITEESTTAALRVLSGCTASMLMIKVPHSCQETPSADIINLGDSRVVVASFNPEPYIQAASIDLNSGVQDEQSLIISQHPVDDPNDIFVGGRLFGETLSTRAFGDGLYKLPLRADQKRDQHRDLIYQLSVHQQAAAASKGRKKIIPLIDRFDTLFWAYKSPPYISSTPQVTKVPLASQDNSPNSKESHRIVGIVATDGLWDMVSSEEAVEILNQASSQDTAVSLSDELNMAQILLDGVVERRGRKPGDDVTILVLVLPL
ncbi:phosphatase 2C-like domain-containing protein [Dactylonectria estremocensis]|uniref:Phosphatase 2C-like domain-containing protein n=1 Tax=Dactylonectria estremocensis TaxID=1079267 RepID=A0A9P9JGF6_9HYPO|nr:phosphatase 2C-like domain-containing protein [Dactylonectria estremocensis]